MIPQNVSFLWLPTWRQTFLAVFLLTDKLYADVINGLQYGIAKMQTNSEMHAKYDLAIYFWENYEYKHRSSIKSCIINDPEMVNFQDTFTDLYDIFLVIT